MDENIMKLVDRLIASERMNAIYEMRFKRLSELIWDKEREHAEYCKEHNRDYRNTINDVDIDTVEVRKAAGIESEKSTVELFASLDKITVEEDE